MDEGTNYSGKLYHATFSDRGMSIIEEGQIWPHYANSDDRDLNDTIAMEDPETSYTHYVSFARSIGNDFIRRELGLSPNSSKGIFVFATDVASIRRSARLDDGSRAREGIHWHIGPIQYGIARTKGHAEQEERVVCASDFNLDLRTTLLELHAGFNVDTEIFEMFREDPKSYDLADRISRYLLALVSAKQNGKLSAPVYVYRSLNDLTSQNSLRRIIL